MQRKLRVWRELPPRYTSGALSRISTRRPASAAVIVAQSAALPPPTTMMSQAVCVSPAAVFAGMESVPACSGSDCGLVRHGYLGVTRMKIDGGAFWSALVPLPSFEPCHECYTLVYR